MSCEIHGQTTQTSTTYKNVGSASLYFLLLKVDTILDQ